MRFLDDFLTIPSHEIADAAGLTGPASGHGGHVRRRRRSRSDPRTGHHGAAHCPLSGAGAAQRTHRRRLRPARPARHQRGRHPRVSPWCGSGRLSAARVWHSASSGWLRIEVTDHATAHLPPISIGDAVEAAGIIADVDDVGSLRLAVMLEVASAWGVDHSPFGRTTWFEIAR